MKAHDSAIEIIRQEAARAAHLEETVEMLVTECREALRWANHRPENWAIQLADRLRTAIARAEGQAEEAEGSAPGDTACAECGGRVA